MFTPCWYDRSTCEGLCVYIIFVIFSKKKPPCDYLTPCLQYFALMFTFQQCISSERSIAVCKCTEYYITYFGKTFGNFWPIISPHQGKHMHVWIKSTVPIVVNCLCLYIYTYIYIYIYTYMWSTTINACHAGWPNCTWSGKVMSICTTMYIYTTWWSHSCLT